MRRLELRDLRSLDRRSMYSIFHPLDPDERLPRELIVEGRRHPLMEIRLLEVAAFLYLPGLVAVIIAMGSLHLPTAVIYTVAGVLVGAFVVFVLRYKPD